MAKKTTVVVERIHMTILADKKYLLSAGSDMIYKIKVIVEDGPSFCSARRE